MMKSHYTVFSLAAVLAIPSLQGAKEDSGQVPDWSDLLDSARENPALEEPVKVLVDEARKRVETPLLRRVYRFEDIGQHRTWLDGRTKYLEDEIRETFGLAMSDFGACGQLSRELPPIAAAYRFTQDPIFLERVVSQLEEMATWSPLQRPGWTLYTPGRRLPADGKDGNWLATGTGVRAIGDTLALLPEGTIEPSLLNRLHDLLENEIASIVDDWETKRSWFIRGDNPITNQWVLPTEGLVRACLILGKETHKDAYELGVKNLVRAMDAHGKDGEFEEGFGYASFTVTSMLHAAHAMAVAGDRRALDHPFLKSFPTWLVHHFQPGNFVINCFDAGGAYGAAERSRSLLSLLAVCTGNPVARWALSRQVGGPSEDLAGLGARSLPPVGEGAAPPLFASYERATRINWRESWEEDSTGVWVRGGHPLDQHDHQDRGHVNFIARGRPILIEAGTPSYDHSLLMTHYSSGVGHNVLQLGTYFPDDKLDTGETARYPGWQKAGGVAPIAVKRLDEQGGEVAVDGSACYEGLDRWERNVEWGVDHLTVTDRVNLEESSEKQIILFRWHLGTDSEVETRGDEGSERVIWEDAEIVFEASSPIHVTQVRLPDHTLAGHDSSEKPENVHTCVAVRSAEPVSSFFLRTRVSPKVVAWE